MSRDPIISIDSMARHTGMGRSRIIHTVNAMKEEGIVRRIGGTRGRWEVGRKA